MQLKSRIPLDWPVVLYAFFEFYPTKQDMSNIRLTDGDANKYKRLSQIIFILMVLLLLIIIMINICDVIRERSQPQNRAKLKYRRVQTKMDEGGYYTLESTFTAHENNK